MEKDNEESKSVYMYVSISAFVSDNINFILAAYRH